MADADRSWWCGTSRAEFRRLTTAEAFAKRAADEAAREGEQIRARRLQREQRRREEDIRPEYRAGYFV